MGYSPVLNWLLEGDVAIQYQVYHDLFSMERADLRKRIATEGWGKRLLSLRRDDGHWGRKFYQPKWTSTHYTLLDLKNLGIDPQQADIRDTLRMLLVHEKGEDGGINPSPNIKESDACLNGMFLNYASYFKMDEGALTSIIDYLLPQRLPDGGFNCRYNRFGARHSSLHSTLSVLEGLLEYRRNGYTYRLPEIKAAEASATAFILNHQLYISDRTGAIIHPDFLKLSYPSRWRYDILRALDYFRLCGLHYDERMAPAIAVLLSKKKRENVWNLQSHHPGQTHFDMETAGKASRWNTLRALRVFFHFAESSPRLANTMPIDRILQNDAVRR